MQPPNAAKNARDWQQGRSMVRFESRSKPAGRIRERMSCLIEIVDLGQHQVAATLAAPPVMLDELLAKGTNNAGTRKRMFDGKITSIPVWRHHRSLNHEVDVGLVAAAVDQLLQIRHGLVRADFAG